MTSLLSLNTLRIQSEALANMSWQSAYNRSENVLEMGDFSFAHIISKLFKYALKFSAVLSLMMSEAVNTPCWSYICSFQENRHGFNN